MRRTRLVAYASACLLFVLVPAATSTAGAAPPRAPRGNRVKLRPEPRVSSAISDFAVGKAAASPVTALVAANGTAYLAYTASTPSGFSSAYVCVLPRGATACSHRTLLPPLDNQTSVDDQPDSLLSGPNGTVDVLVTSRKRLEQPRHRHGRCPCRHARVRPQPLRRDQDRHPPSRLA